MNKLRVLLWVALAAAPAAKAQNAIGEVYSGDASVRGAVFLSGSGTHVLSGSQVTAGGAAALLKLERGGELRICPKTNVSLSADAAGKALVLGLSMGAMEIDYSLSGSSDLLMTPDFRLQLIGPGAFHLAVSVAPNGDTCLRSLPGNDAAVFVAETMGVDSYQLAPGKNVMFRAGKIAGAADAPPACGCPQTPPAMLVRACSPDSPNCGADVGHPQAPEKPETVPATANAHPHNPVHLEVDSAFVYRGDEAVQDSCRAVARLSLSTDNSKLALALLPQVAGPAAESKPAPKNPGMLRRLGKFLARLFQD